MKYDKYILVCGQLGCDCGKSDPVYNGFLQELEQQNLTESVQVVRARCLGYCDKGPIAKVLPDESLYVRVTPDDVKELVSEHVIQGKKVSRLLCDNSTLEDIVKIEGNDFYQKQFRIVLRNCGFIDPENINEYIARDGYLALEKVLFEMTPEDVISELKISGLRGRGGAGYPTWLKWTFTRDCKSDEKYVVCNADEGDPGAYMDRSTLEGDPHSVLEAMIIAGYATGASQGCVYIRAEYPLAIHRLEVAIAQARELGLLGEGILGSEFSFDIELRLGAGAFVCGEETALLASVEGKRGMPRPRPPFPAVKGLWGKPTVINNVETLANIPVIITRGGEWFSKIGTEKSTGTKVFALTGKVSNSGLIEVPMGITLREIIYDIGCGVPGGRKLKAVQTGGPSGGVITTDYLDTPIDYENLSSLGSIMGSGGMIVMDEDDCMVDVAKFYLDFTVDESCGKCAPCRIGGRQLYDLLDKVTKGEATESTVARMRQVSQAMSKASLCGLGQTASNPVISTLKYFEDEYMAHILEKRCPAGRCSNLLKYRIIPEKCIGCGLCARKCPVNAITGQIRQAHVIDEALCINCGACEQACKFGAVIRK